MKSMKTACAVGALMAFTGTAALAQSTGASPADPNNERNQRPAMSNTQPSDPGTDSPSARVPTDPDDAASAAREEGGADGSSSGDAGVDNIDPQPLPEASDTTDLPPAPADTE
jgi:hypothetical protein